MTSYRRDGDDVVVGDWVAPGAPVAPGAAGAVVDPATGAVLPTEPVAQVVPGDAVPGVVPAAPVVGAVPTAPLAAPTVVQPAVAPARVVDPRLAPAATVVAGPEVVATDQVVRRSFSAYSASQIVHGMAAILLLLLGAFVVARGGFDGPAENQVASVLGIETTTPIGLVLLAAGLLLAIAALTPSGRPFGGFVGVLLAVFGIVVIAAGDDLSADLRTDPALGWILLVVGIVCVVAAFLPDEVRARRQQVLVR